jgi:hypothetical protein
MSITNGIPTRYAQRLQYWITPDPSVDVPVPAGKRRYVMLPLGEVAPKARTVAEQVFNRACKSVGLPPGDVHLRFYAQFDDLDEDDEQQLGRQLPRSFTENKTLRGIFGADFETHRAATVMVRIGPDDSLADVAETTAHELAHAAKAARRPSWVENKALHPLDVDQEEAEALDFGQQARAWYERERNGQ